MTNNVYSVSTLSLLIQNGINDMFPYPIKVEGEIIKLREKGHLYFHLQEGDDKIPVAMWRTYAEKLNIELKDGLKVILTGRIEYSGKYDGIKFLATKAEPAGIGKILEEIENNKRLWQNTYFKKPKKKIPTGGFKNIAILTSISGSVIKDIINVRNKRNKSVNLTIIDTCVQGELCISSVVNNFKRINNMLKKDPLCFDAVILARGGGSFSDLLPFNDEQIVKAVYNCPLPVFSSIGHDTDTPLVDMVSDIRCATPTQAAEFAIEDKNECLKKLINIKNEIEHIIQKDLILEEQRINNLKSEIFYNITSLSNRENRKLNNYKTIMTYSLHNRIAKPLYYISNDMNNSITKKLNNEKNKLAGFKNLNNYLIDKLNWNKKLLLNYNQTFEVIKNQLTKPLEKGYAILRDESGNIINDNKISKDATLIVETKKHIIKTKVINNKSKKQ